jgi:hypothetical protein
MVGRGRMMLGKVVCMICLAFAPVNLKLDMADTVADPIEAHANGFGSFLFYGVGDDGAGGVVVGGHWCCRLRVPHFFKGYSQGTCFLSIVKQGAEFSFGGSWKQFVHDVTQDVDGTVGFEGRGWRRLQIG